MRATPIPTESATTHSTRDGLQPWVTRVALAACAGFLFALIAYNFVDIDLWHEMALIRESAHVGHLLEKDPYAYTPTIQPWIDHEWGAGALAYFGTAWFGPRSIIVLKFLSAFGVLASCLACARIRGADFRLVSLCAPLAIFLLYLGFLATVRAQVYTFLFTALLLYLLEVDRRGRRIWIAPWLLIFAVWVNLHAGFVVGIGIVILHALERACRHQPWRHLLFVFLAMVSEIFLNPYGSAYFSYLRRAVFMPRPYSPEWGSFLTLGNPLATVFVLALLVGICAALKAGWTHLYGLPIFLATAIEAAFHRKLMPLFAIAWLCYVPPYLQRTPVAGWWFDFCSRRRRFLLFAWAGLGCVSLFAGIRQRPWNLSVSQPPYPVGPILYLRQHKFMGNLLVPFHVGAFVLWNLYPEVKISLDSRYEVAYSDSVMKQVFDFYDGRAGWHSTLAAYPTDAVLLPKDAPVLTKFDATGWRCVYIDRQFKIYVRPALKLPVEDWSARSFEGTLP